MSLMQGHVCRQELKHIGHQISRCKHPACLHCIQKVPIVVVLVYYNLLYRYPQKKTSLCTKPNIFKTPSETFSDAAGIEPPPRGAVTVKVSHVSQRCRTMQNYQNSKAEILKDQQENFSSYSTVADVSVVFLCCDRGSPEGSLAILAMSMRSSTWKHPIIHRNLWMCLIPMTEWFW